MSTENTNPPNDQQNPISDYANEILQIQMEGNERSVRKARNALFWAGGLIFFFEMFFMFRAGLGFEPIVFGFALIVGGVFVGLGLWTKKKPYTAIILGLVAFIGYIALGVVLNGIVDGSAGVVKALFSGIIVKVIILVNLILPIKDAKELQEQRAMKF